MKEIGMKKNSRVGIVVRSVSPPLGDSLRKLVAKSCGCAEAPVQPQECIYDLEIAITPPTLCRCCEQCRDLCAMEV